MPLRVENLRHLDWQPYTVQSYQSWCGHTQEIIPFPRADGSVAFIDVVGEASQVVDISKEHAIETFKPIVQISLEGLKLLALFNGGAAVALLAYLGNVAGCP